MACGMSLSALHTQRRTITRLYTSFYKGELFPNQLVRPKQRVSGAGSFRGAMKSVYGVDAAAKVAAPQDATHSSTPQWDDATALDVLGSKASTAVATPEPQRPYVPLQEAAEVELKGDYLLEAGMAQDALQCYGVVTTLYNLAYPENHSQRVGITIKLAVAFRQTNRLDSSRANLEAALLMLDASSQPSLELICETLMELGLTLEVSGDTAGAAKVFEDAVAIVDAFHNGGESHRMLRLLPRLGRRFSLNGENKFLYFSPFDYDRTFAMADRSLGYAERCYEAAGDAQGIVRVLTLRKQLQDKKYFNMNDFAGRIRTMRGHWMRRANHLTNAPTPEELLLYSPTIHQVHRDFRYETTAPIGLENEVASGTNRVVLDDGTPFRKLRKPRNTDKQEFGSRKALQKAQWE